MLNEAWMMFSRQKKKIKQHYQRKETVQWLWPEMEKDYRNSTTVSECTKKQKTLLGTGSEGYKGLLLNIIHLSVVLADSMIRLPFLLHLSMYSAAAEGTAFLSSSSLPWSTA